MASLSLPFSLERPSSTSDLKINGGLCLCAVSQNGGLAGLAVPYEATSCLSDHLAIWGLLRRDELITQGPLRDPTPKVWTYSFLYLSSCSKSTLTLLHPVPSSSWFMSSSLVHFVHLPLSSSVSLLLSSYWDYPVTHSDSSYKALLKGTFTTVVRAENNVFFCVVFNSLSQLAFASQSEHLNQWPSSITSLAVHVHVIKKQLWKILRGSFGFSKI